MFSPQDQFEQAITATQRAVNNGRFKLAILHQQRVVAILRQINASHPHPDIHGRLSLELYNLAMYHAEQQEWHEAVTALTETVTIDQQLNHPDLTSEQEALTEARFKLMTTAVQ